MLLFKINEATKRFYETLKREIVGGLTALWLLCFIFYCIGSFPEISFNQTLLSNLKVHIAGLGFVLGVALLLMRAPLRGVNFMLLAAFGIFTPVYSLKTAEFSPDNQGQVLDVISFNVLHYNKQGAKAFEYLKNSEADVLVIAEAGPLREFAGQLRRVYPYKIGCGDVVCELMIFSKYPFVKAKQQHFPWGANRLSTASIDFNGQEVRVIATHLTKSFFSDLRMRELYHIIRTIREDSTPYIIAGDFNATPWSPEIQRLLKSTNTYLINRTIGTWPVMLHQYGLPIDHIMLSGGLKPVSYEALPSAFGSNHRGVRAKIVVDGN